MLGVGSLVSVNLNGTGGALSVILQIQPPFFGRISAGGGPFDVVWQDGRVVTNVDGGALDELFEATEETRNRLFLQVVRPAGSDGRPVSSPRFDGEVVAVYRRREASNPELALVRGINTGTYRELAADSLSVVPGL